MSLGAGSLRLNVHGNGLPDYALLTFLLKRTIRRTVAEFVWDVRVGGADVVVACWVIEGERPEQRSSLALLERMNARSIPS